MSNTCYIAPPALNFMEPLILISILIQCIV